MSVLIFFVVLFVLILVHEWGHFIAAKKTGMRVDEFGIGFPPKLFGVKKGETEYTFNALPIGGFVRILGENAVNEDGKEIEGGDCERSFVAKPKWAQAVVLVAGVTMNILFAWFLIGVVFMMGVPTVVDEETATAKAQLMVTGVLPTSPAEEAGLNPGVAVVNVEAGGDYMESLTPNAFSDFTKSRSGEEVKVTYSNGRDQETVTLVPEAGLIEEDSEKVLVGVALALVEKVSKPVHVAFYDAAIHTVTSLVAITVGITNLIADSFSGSADFSQVAGPVGIVNLVGDAAQFGLASLLMFTAIISLNLAVINLLPFPALDGGRLVMVAIESVTRKPIKPIWVARVNMVGFILLMLLMIAVTYNDILRII